jgi:peptidoglycan/LPS O-acetylase OafA/YrhL
MKTKRILYLDGLRGVAILSVIFFHAYSRWESIETFKQSEIFRIFFSYGFLGVNLFFSISGYVIYMSLRKFDNIMLFGFARYLRLAPAMIIASIFIFLSSFLIPERPLGVSNIQDFLPSITFIGPDFFSKILGIHVRSLDGAFWSLYVEVSFYFFSAIMFFGLKDKELKGLVVLFILYLILVFLMRSGLENIYAIGVKKILGDLGFGYYGWFLLGIYSCKYGHFFLKQKSVYSLILISLITIFAESMRYGGNLEILIASSVVASIFITPLFNKKIKLILSSNILLFFGFISYPLYLIHQNLVTGLAIKLYNSGIELPNFFYPLPFLILAILLSFLIAKLEPLIKNLFLKKFPNKLFGMQLNQKQKSIFKKKKFNSKY